MISVVVCSKEPTENNLHERNIARTIGCGFEYIRIDNTDNQYGICEAYNLGARRASGEVTVFVHEDVFFMEPGWGHTLLHKFKTDAALGLVGVAGAQYLCRNHPFWPTSGRPFIRGRVIHQIDSADKFYMTIYHREMTDTEVVAVDGLFLGIRTGLLDHILFDAHTFDHFHMYDMDICMQVGRTHKVIVTYDILCKHLSKGSYDTHWRKYARLFTEKYAHELPRSCATIPPIPNNPDTFECYDLRGRLPREHLL